MDFLNHPASHPLLLNLAIIVAAVLCALLLENAAALLLLSFMQPVPAYAGPQSEEEEVPDDYSGNGAGFTADVD